MLYPKRKNKTDLKIEKIAKKLGVFTLNDIQTLMDESITKILKSLDFLTFRNIIKKEEDCYIYVAPKPRTATKKKIAKPKNEDDFFIEATEPKVKTPRQVYIKKFGHLKGFIHFFFSDLYERKKVIEQLKLLKDAEKYTGGRLQEFLNKKKVSLSKYNKLKAGVTLYGFEYILDGHMLEEPIEVYNYFKEYYLSPLCLNEKQALMLAISKFSRLIDVKIPMECYSSYTHYLNKLRHEYRKDEIIKFRTYNFSKIDVESLEEYCNYDDEIFGKTYRHLLEEKSQNDIDVPN